MVTVVPFLAPPGGGRPPIVSASDAVRDGTQAVTGEVRERS